MEAPIPDEEIPAWKYLDIYLFSNGQENSPPRKYHLVSDNLDLWTETLKELAQEQFGSPDNNISLYTTQGRLVKTPLELNHNKAYVAVSSPEEFIDAGYDRYLLKATRSWEKRQDKRSSNTAENPGEDLVTRKSDPESIAVLKTIVPSMLDHLGSVIVKPRNTSGSKPQDRAERNSNKRSSLSRKNDTVSTVKSIKPTTQRKETNMHSDETADESTPSKSPFKGRVPKVLQKRRNSDAVVSKVEEVVNQLENSSPRNVEHVNAKTRRNENHSRVTTKPVENEKDQQNKPKPLPHLYGNRPRILMTKPVENEKDQQRAKLKPFSNSIESRNRTAINSGETVKYEQNKPKIMPHFNENQYDTKVIDPYFDTEQYIKENNQTLGDIVSENEDVIYVGTPLNNLNNNKNNQQNCNDELVPTGLPTENKQKPRDKTENVNKAESSINTLNKINDDPLKKKETLSPQAASTMTNTLTDLSKGIINMRIEVWSSSDVKRNASCDIKAPVIILTNEIGSQVDMAGQSGQNKGLHQVIASDIGGIDGNYKIVLVRSSDPNNDACDGCKHSVIGECVMFLPVIKLDELYCRCSGGETNDNNALGTNSSVVNPVKKTSSCMPIPKENAKRISIVTEVDEEFGPKSGGEINDINALGTNSSVVNPVKKTSSCMPIPKENAKRISIVTEVNEEFRPKSDGETNDINALGTNSNVVNPVKKTSSGMPIPKENEKRISIVTEVDEEFRPKSGGETNDINALGTNSSVVNPVKKAPSYMSIHTENGNRTSIVTEVHEEFRPKSVELNDTIQDKTEPLEQNLSMNDKQFEESTKTENSPLKLIESVRISKGHIVNRNSESTNSLPKHEVPPKYTLDSKENEQEKELSVSQPDYREPVDSEESKPKQIKMLATQLFQQTRESVTSKISKFSESKVPEASHLEKDKELKMGESVEISHSKTEPFHTPELSSTHAKSAESSKGPSATSLGSKRTSIRQTEENTLQSHNEKLTSASAVAEATSLLETRVEPAKPRALTQDKASQTEWTDMLWEAKLHEDGHYSFHLPALSRLKEYNL